MRGERILDKPGIVLLNERWRRRPEDCLDTVCVIARPPFTLAGVKVEPDRNLITGAGAAVRVEPKVMDVLCALAAANGEVVSREALIGAVWAVDFGGDESVSRAVSLLRKALKEAGLGEEAIETVTKRGYRLTIASAPAGDIGAAAEPAPQVSVSASAPRKPIKLIAAALSVLVIALVAAFVVTHLVATEVGIGVKGFRAAVTRPAPAEAPVIAVLPFDDLSPGGDFEWFAEGLADELIDNLSRVPGLVVIGRTSSFQFGRNNLGARAIGEKLGARYLIEGGVRRDGEDLRISAMLIDTRDQTTVWSESFDRKTGDVFAAQADLARAIVSALNIRMSMGDPTRMAGTSSTQAFDAFLLGRAYLRAEGAENILRASEQFRRAIALDPDYLDAYFGLIGSLGVYDFWRPDELQAANAERAEAAAAIARIDPLNGANRVIRAWTLAADGDIAGADRLFRKVFWGQRAQGCSNIAFVETLLYGRFVEDFDTCFATVKDLDPFDLSIAENNQFQAHMIGRDDIAAAEYRRSLSIPGGPGLGDIYAFLRAFKAGDRAGARERFKAVIDFLPARVAEFDAVYAQFDDDAAVREILNAARVNPANQDPTRLVMIAKLLAIYGDPAGAADALNRHYLKAGGTWWQELWMPEHAATRREAAFREIIREKGFERFFRKSGKWNDFCRPVSATEFECF
jgi:TolB-like protein/DNA-binding winged helix-turn-helix (wHTH) protein